MWFLLIQYVYACSHNNSRISLTIILNFSKNVPFDNKLIKLSNTYLVVTKSVKSKKTQMFGSSTSFGTYIIYMVSQKITTGWLLIFVYCTRNFEAKVFFQLLFYSSVLFIVYLSV